MKEAQNISKKSNIDTSISRQRLLLPRAGITQVEVDQNDLVTSPASEYRQQDFSQVPVSRTDALPFGRYQPKLTIGAPGDKYEQEADRVAAQVVNQINAPVAQQSVQNQLQETPAVEIQTRPWLRLQAKDGGMAAPASLESSIQQARGGGQPLTDNIRTPMEQAFGADFSGVKVHTGSQADQLNQSIQAKAFTTGQDVFFRQGEYQPGSRGGQELLAHELTHVRQENGGAVQRSPLPQQQLSQHPATEISVVQRTVTPDQLKTTNYSARIKTANIKINNLKVNEPRQRQLINMAKGIKNHIEKDKDSDLTSLEKMIIQLEEAIDETSKTFDCYKASLAYIQRILEVDASSIKQAKQGFEKRLSLQYNFLAENQWEKIKPEISNPKSELNKLKDSVSKYDPDVIAKENADIEANKITKQKSYLNKFFSNNIDFDLAIKNNNLMDNVSKYIEKESDTLKQLIKTYGEDLVLEQLKKKQARPQDIREKIQKSASIAYHLYDPEKNSRQQHDLQEFASNAEVTLKKLIKSNPDLEKGPGQKGEKTKASMQLLQNGQVIEDLNYSVYVSGSPRTSDFTYGEDQKKTRQGAENGETSLKDLTYAAGSEGHVHERTHDTEVKILERTLAFLKDHQNKDLTEVTLRVFVSRYTCPSCSDLFYKAKNQHSELKALKRVEIVYTKQAF